MKTLKESKEHLLRQIKRKAYSHILRDKTSRTLMRIYDLVAALPVSSQIFEWYRVSQEKVQIELIHDKLKIYKIDGQYFEQIEFGEGDLCNLIYRALENKN
jgi:hypothetical protein